MEEDTVHMWQRLSLVSSYKPRDQAIAASSPSLPNGLDQFKSRFDEANTVNFTVSFFFLIHPPSLSEGDSK